MRTHAWATRTLHQGLCPDQRSCLISAHDGDAAAADHAAATAQAMHTCIQHPPSLCRAKEQRCALLVLTFHSPICSVPIVKLGLATVARRHQHISFDHLWHVCLFVTKTRLIPLLHILQGWHDRHCRPFQGYGRSASVLTSRLCYAFCWHRECLFIYKAIEALLSAARQFVPDIDRGKVTPNCLKGYCNCKIGLF